ncbi:MAG: transporter substrate-binding domain-containing protein [Pseudomonadota bacterium]|nr:transporter substrate-binding domain-containing protein [Pseudomonadota bacterium]
MTARVWNLGGWLLTLALLAGGLQAARADEIDTIKSRGTLIVGVKADYVPFGFRSPSGQIDGIEPALAADVAKRLGVKLELVPVNAANRMQFLTQGKIDLMIATMNDTPERRRVLDIVQPDYYASSYTVMAPKAAKLASWSDLNGKPICAIQGSFYNKVVAQKDGAQIIAFTGTAEALTALRQGRCIAFLYDDTAIEGQLLNPEWKDYAMPLPAQDPQPWGLAVRKGEPKWAEYMSNVIKDWAKTGEILKLETQYKIPNSQYAQQQHDKYAK